MKWVFQVTLTTLLLLKQSLVFAEPKEIILSDGRVVTITHWTFEYESLAKENGSICEGLFSGLAPTKSGELIEYALNAKGPIDVTGEAFNVEVFDVYPTHDADWPKMKGALGLRNCKTVIEKGVIPIFIEEGLLRPDGSFNILGDQVRLESRSLGGAPERPGYISKHALSFQCDPEVLNDMGLLPALNTEDLVNTLETETTPNLGAALDAGGDLPRIPSALPCDDIPKIPAPDGKNPPGKVPHPSGSSSWDDIIKRLFR